MSSTTYILDLSDRNVSWFYDLDVSIKKTSYTSEIFRWSFFLVSKPNWNKSQALIWYLVGTIFD